MMPNADLSGDMLIIFIGVAVFVLAILVLLFTKRLGMFLLTIGVLAVIAVVALSMLSQAEASREAAKAAKTAATAATVASAGQTANSFALAMLSGALIVVTLIALGGVGYFWIRVRQAENERITNIRAQRQARSGKWTSGPHALWGRDGQSPNPQSYLGGDTYPMSLLLQQLMSMQAMMMQAWMRPQVGPQYPPAPPRRQGRQPAQLGWEWDEWDGQSDGGAGEEESDPPVPLDWGW